MSLQSLAVVNDYLPAFRQIKPRLLSSDTSWFYFPHIFQAQLALTTAQKHRVFQLRHKVYCEEMGFEPVRADGLENDQYDERALHASITHASSGKLAGTVRIISSDNQAELLPIEKLFSTQIAHSEFAPNKFSRAKICEISRLAVPENIRLSSLRAQSGCSDIEDACCKMVAISLYLQAIIMCLRSGRYHAFVIIEPALARILKRIGINFVQIGDAIDFNGLRAPYYLDMRTTESTLKPEYRTLRDTLESQLYKRKDSSKAQISLCYSA